MSADRPPSSLDAHVVPPESKPPDSLPPGSKRFFKPEPEPDRPWMRWLVPAAILLCAGVWVVLNVLPRKVDGEVVASGRVLGGEWSLDDAECISGARRGFVGVDIVPKADTGHSVRVVQRGEKKPMVFVSGSKDDRSVVLSPEKCAVYDVQLDETPGDDGAIGEISGTLKLDCENVAGGGRLRADLDLSDCH